MEASKKSAKLRASQNLAGSTEPGEHHGGDVPSVSFVLLFSNVRSPAPAANINQEESSRQEIVEPRRIIDSLGSMFFGACFVDLMARCPAVALTLLLRAGSQ
jgi:hypothetical protein